MLGRNLAIGVDIFRTIRVLYKMAQGSQMIETLDDCFVKTANNIMKHYGKILAREVRNTLVGI